MKHRFGATAILFIVAASMTGQDLSACGDKFLVLSRGTRYQRPKNARSASVLIYADPSSGLPQALKSVRADSMLKQEGHRATIVQTREQLSAIVANGRFDVVLAARSVAADIEPLLGASSDRAIVVSVDPRTKAQTLLEEIDKAVERRDQNVKKLQGHS